MKRTIVAISALVAGICLNAAADGVHGLRVNRLVHPANVVKPTFSWKMESGRKGAAQSAYRIVVRDAAGAAVWDSGEVECPLSGAVPYKGPALKPSARYFWEVQTRNDKGVCSEPAKSCFDTALAPDDW